MTDKPIIFSGPMVRALIEGRKTQTRRVLNPQPSAGVRVSPFVSSGLEDGRGREINLRYAPSDRLYVREAWRTVAMWDKIRPCDLGTIAPIKFEADDAKNEPEYWASLGQPVEYGRFRQGMHMPRWASRLTLTVTDVRVQRLQEISELGAVAEGIEIVGLSGHAGAEWRNYLGSDPFIDSIAPKARLSFASLWDSLHGPDAWDANPWVVALTFTVERRNIDHRVQE